MGIKGNKGEWSELYAFVKLLSLGKLYAADEHLNRLDKIFFPIIKILRREISGLDTEYLISPESGLVKIYCHSDEIGNICNKDLVGMADHLYNSIVSGINRSFEIEGSDEIMNRLACSKISASSSDKTDITMQIHDIHTGYDPTCEFSIKSELGSAPTLLNASGATNFVFEIIGINDNQANIINNINTSTKIIDRISLIYKLGNLKFRFVKNENFRGNLMLIDTHMNEILAEILTDFYTNKAQKCKDLIDILESRNPLKFPRQGLYEYKFKKFLCSVALGMMPSREWNGQDEANGGYIIVKNDGDVVAYHIYNRDAFETYLLNNTKLERGSTEKHGFASVYKVDNKFYINLNLQIRFI